MNFHAAQWRVLKKRRSEFHGDASMDESVKCHDFEHKMKAMYTNDKFMELEEKVQVLKADFLKVVDTKLDSEVNVKLINMEAKMEKTIHDYEDLLDKKFVNVDSFNAHVKDEVKDMAEKMKDFMSVDTCNKMFEMLLNQGQDNDNKIEKLAHEMMTEKMSEKMFEMISNQMKNQNQKYDHLEELVSELEKDLRQRKKVFEKKFHEYDMQMVAQLTEETFSHQLHEFNLHVESKLSLSEQRLLAEVKTAMEAIQYAMNVQVENVLGEDVEGHGKKKIRKPRFGGG